MHVDPRLPRSVFGWRSPRLGLEMPIVGYGDRGHPLLLFPTAQADYLEYERFGLIRAVERHIAAGRVRVFSINSINAHAWMNREVPVAEKARRQALYSAYVEEEVVPYVREAVGDRSARLATAGASFGAFHAMNALLRRPDRFDAVIAMSGFYDLERDYLGGYHDDNCYFNNPAWYLPRLNDPVTLHTLRTATQIHILSGRGAYEAPHEAERMSRLLAERDIPHHLDLWGHDVNHDWPWWCKMLDHYLAERLGW